MEPLAKLQKYVQEAENLYNRLVLVVGPPGSGKSKLLRQLEGVKIVNINKELTRELVNIPQEDMSIKTQELLSQIVSSYSEQVLVLDNIELLFLPDLELDPLKAFEHLSRNKTLVVAWTGHFDGNKLVWAEPDHPEYRVYTDKSCPDKIVQLIG